MRIILNTKCPRCGVSASTEGLSIEVAREVAAAHVCADGTATPSGEPVERIVEGPGERTIPEVMLDWSNSRNRRRARVARNYWDAYESGRPMSSDDY